MRSISCSSRNFLFLLFVILSCWPFFDCRVFAEELSVSYLDLFLGPRVNLKSSWSGKEVVTGPLFFLIMAGHADSQGIAGAGTSGEAVGLKGERPLDPYMSDELFWNLKIRDAIVRLGKERGLSIKSYDPVIRNIVDGNHPSTNWSVGARHVRSGGYALEIHFDSFGEYGFGSGLIPAISSKLNTVDENLANAFGRYPIFFRGGLGAPRRGIRILEIGKLEGQLERGLRDLNSREKLINDIAFKVVQALLLGVSNNKPLNPPLDVEDIVHQVSGP